MKNFEYIVDILVILLGVILLAVGIVKNNYPMSIFWFLVINYIFNKY